MISVTVWKRHDLIIKKPFIMYTVYISVVKALEYSHGKQNEKYLRKLSRGPFFFLL